ncbi:MAG: hypothetical protein JNL32_05975 [Candidatus Kapabacteria bacterium]|nr:hypothetical protein [Candidatus Kapabacteria bacterium]
MKTFGLDYFTAPVDDAEKRQYDILGALQQRRSELSRTRLYPVIAELIELRETLQLLIEQKGKVDAAIPKQLTDVDWESKQLTYTQQHSDPQNLEKMFDLIEWSLPFLDAVIDEGKVLYDFVDENIILEDVGIVPMYTNEGYFFVPEHRSHIIHVLRYELSMLMSDGQHYRAMRTNEIEQVEEGGIIRTPEAIKLHIISTHRELPNPATFVCETELDFPYYETILPVVKRKLMMRLAA